MNLRANCTFGYLVLATLLFGQGGAQFFGDFRTVKALAFSEDGKIWAGTRGGLMLCDAPARTYGWNGLIDGRGIDDLWFEGSTLYGSAGDSVATWNGARWLASNRQPRVPKSVSFAEGGFVVPPRPVWPDDAFAPPPNNNGTHVTAVVGNGPATIAAWYGDGLWAHEGGSWTRTEEAFPFVRSMAAREGELALATFDGAMWLRSGRRWKQIVPVKGLQGSIYSVAADGTRVVAGTFEHGLYAFDGKWSAMKNSLDQPREMAIFRNRLYVRQTTGRVDRYDGSRWAQNVLRWLLRGEATSLSAGAGRLLVGQFGGWSEFDGTRWSHFLKIPALQGIVVTAVAAQGEDRWIGTQGRGVFHLKGGEMFDQRNGLGDDWVRRILVDRRSVIVGMFLGGAFAKRENAFTRLTPEVEGEATGLVRAPNGKLYIGTREGLWRDGKRVPIAGLNPEIQAMLGTARGLWLGLPNGTAFIPWAALK